MEDVPEFKITADAKFSDIIVPTMDTVRCTFMLEFLLGCQITVGNLCC